MTIGEWHNNKSFYMIWCIYNEESYSEYDNQPYEDYDNIILDFTAPEGVPDGMYTVYHHAGSEDEGKSIGVMVLDGQFVPEPTQASIFEAVCKSYGITANDVREGKEGIDHIFIEFLNWDSELNAFEVVTGS